MPPIEVKKEITIAVSGGNSILVFTPETGKSMVKKSIQYTSNNFKDASGLFVQAG